jgi:hypothetical protein
LIAGSEVRILGVGALEGWWVVNNPIYENVPCWVDKSDVAVSMDHDLDSLPVFEVPLLPNQTPEGGGKGNPEGPEDCDPSTEYWSIEKQSCEPFG